DPPALADGCWPFAGRRPCNHECGDEAAKPRTGPRLVLRQGALDRAVPAVRGVRVPHPSARGDRPGLYDSRGGEGRAAVLRRPRGSGGSPDGPADRGEDPGECRLAEEEREGPRPLVCIVEGLTSGGKVFLGRGRWEDANAW